MSANGSLLRVSELQVHFSTRDGALEAVDRISFEIGSNEIFGLVGESGSGKSITALSILGLVPSPGRIVGGDIVFGGRNLRRLPERALRTIRGREVGMIFQNPRASLDPVRTVAVQLSRALRAHHDLSRAEVRDQSIRTLRDLGMPDPEAALTKYPHQLSGGMCQRVMVAMMLSSRPRLLIADEPTTALDETVGAQLLEHLRQFKEEHAASILLITHDMGVIAEMCDRVGVMHAGHVVEVGPVGAVFRDPRHPYTRALLDSTLRIDRDSPLSDIERIPGVVPNLLHPPPGCRFADRCAYALPVCRSARPPRLEVAPAHHVLCQETVIREFAAP